MNPEFWRGKRVLITGHTGFKGGWLSLWLQSLGAKVAGLSLAPTGKPSLFEVANIAGETESSFADIRDLPGLAAAIERQNPEVVFHLAAQSLVRASYTDPVETYTTNVIGTVNVLEAIRRNGKVRACIVVTSDKCYENREWHWPYREIDPMGGHDPYSSSKGCAELVTAAYRASYFDPATARAIPCAIASVRSGNLIGGGDWSTDRLVPDLIRAIDRGERLVLRNPNSVRSWQHVLDPLSGYLLLAERLWHDGAKCAGAWNFGPSPTDVRSVEWIVERFVAAWGEKVDWAIDSGPHPHEARVLSLDSTKARMVLGWQPRWTIDQALASIADWHRAYRTGQPMTQVVRRQIEAYSRALNGVSALNHGSVH
jgi:CDP-glucose 4,6-dehydratase